MSVDARGTISATDSGVGDSAPYTIQSDSSERPIGSDTQAILRQHMLLQYANMPQPVMLPGGQYYVVQPVPQFQKNGVTYYGAAAIEKQRTHLFVDSIREQYLSMNNPVRNEPDVYTASVVNPSNSSTQNGLLVEQPYVKGTIMQSSVTPSQSAVIAQQPNVQIAVQQPLVNYQSCYSFPSNYDRSTPQQVQFFCSQPSTPSPSAGDQTRFSFVAVNTNEQCEGAVPSRAYSQPTLACVPSASLPASKASVPVLHSVTSLNCSQNPTAVVPGYKPQLTSSNETVAGAQDMTYVQSGGFTMSRPQSSVGVLPAASVPATPTPYQPVAPTPYEPQQCGQTQSAQLPGSVVMEDGRVVYLQPQPLRPEAPFFPAPGQPFLQGPVVAAPSQIAQPFGGSGIPSQQFVQQGQACFLPRFPSTAVPLVVQNTRHPLMVARREPQRPRVFISPLRLPTVRIAPNPRVAEMAKRPNLVSLTATPPSYNPSNVNRNRKKPAVVLPYTGFKRKEEKEESEDENTSRNVTAQKRWGEPPQTINVPKVESVDKSEKEDTGAHSVDNTNLTTKGEGATNATGSTNGDVHFVREHSVEHDQCGVKREEDRAEADKASAEKTATNENGDKSAANSQESKSHAGAKCGGDIATPRTLTVSNNEDYADEGSSPRSAMRVGSHLSTAMECAYCRSKKEPPEVYRSHSLRNTRTGITTCPKLRQQVCALCNATGDQAHTPYFCPLNRNRGAGTRSSNGVGAPMRALQSGGRPSWPQRRGGGVSLQAKSDLRAYADALAGRSVGGGGHIYGSRNSASSFTPFHSRMHHNRGGGPSNMAAG